MAKLVVRKGEKAGTEYPVSGQSLILGRSMECDIQIPSVKASRKHTEIFLDDGSYSIRDLHSSNGTYLNRKYLETEERIYNGDRIRIGHNVLEFVDENGPPRPGSCDGDATALEEPGTGNRPAGIIDPGGTDYRVIGLGIAAILALIVLVVLGYAAVTGFSGGGTRAESGPPAAESAAPANP